jgi:MATE family multidrug resistance protein
VGLCAAIDTLASQAWGAKNYKKIGIYVQRSVLILGLAMLLICSFWFNIESILHLIHQPPCVIDYTVQYIQVAMLALPAIFLYTILQRYLQAQNIVYPFIITGLCANILNALAHYLFLFVAKWGVQGAAGAVVLSWYTLLISLLIIIYVRKLHVKTWGGWSRECLKDWGQFAKFSVLGLCMVIVEWISFEIGFFVSGFVGNIQQAIHSLLCSFIFVLFTISKALSMTAAIRVGNELGAGNIRGAKRALFVILTLDVAWTIFIASMVVGLKDYIPMIFTTDADVLQAMGPIMYVAAGVLIGGNMQVILAGVVRGSGRQTGGAAANFTSFWVFGVPLGIVLVFVAHLGIFGFWLGLLLGEVMQMLIYGTIVLTIRWKKQVMKAQKMAHMRENSEPLLNEKSPLIQASSGLPEYDSNIWSKGEVDSSLVTRSQNEERSPQPVKVGCITVVVRVLTCAVFVLVLIGGVALSQLCVYRCDFNIQNHTNTSNSSLNLIIADIRANYSCTWKFVDFVH